MESSQQTENSEPNAATDLESKIQGQFNEEKWTRVSAKDVSISRFNLLENILNQAIEESYLPQLKDLAKKHLEQYDASVAARYFLGMVALKQNLPDEIVYLKQLLDQFQEISKWAVVEYLSDKMLQVSENRTILRAKATALEKLAKTKEAIPVLEKLAKIDRKNPDVALKYADAIINDDMDKAIQFYKQAAESFAKTLQFEKLRTVWNKLVELIPEDLQFFRKIERVLSGHRQKDILADLYVQLANQYMKNEDLDNFIILSKKILEYNPNYLRFKKELVDAYRKKYETHSLFEDFVKLSGLNNNKKNIINAIQDFETNIVFDKDNYVYHRSWGVGKIKEINTEEMIVDFHDKESHRMEIQMGLKSLKPLTEDHFWVAQFERPEELEKMFEEDIVEFFKLMLGSFGGKMSLAEIKLEVCDRYVPLRSWSKWWTKVRNQLLKDNLISISPQKRDIIELHETPVTMSDQVIEKFQAAQSFDEKTAAALETLKNPDDHIEAIEYIQPFFNDLLKSYDFEMRLQSIFVLDMLHESLGDEERIYEDEVQKNIENDFKELPFTTIALMSDKMKNPEMKRHLARWVHRLRDDWKKLYIEMLFQTPIKIHKQLLTEIIEDGDKDEIEEFFTRLRRESKENPEVFLWVLKNVISGTWEIENFTYSEQFLTLFRLMRNLHKLEAKGTKLKNMAKDIVTGSTKDEFFALVKENALNSIRKLASLVKDISFLTEYERDQILDELRKLAPEEFADQEGFEPRVTAQSLMDTLKKTGATVASQNAIDQMQKEIDHLIKIEIPENSKEIGLAQEKGDLRENAEYKAALENQTILQANLARLESQFKEVSLLTANQVMIDEVMIGCKVKLKEMKKGDLFVYIILDQWDADVDKGIISYKSPLGQAMLHSKKGDKFKFGTGSSEQEFEVLSIEKALDADGRLS